MAVTFANRARMSTATTGTGTITLGSASTGYMSFSEAGIANGNTVSYCIEDGNNFEVGHGVYSSAGGMLTRSVIASKINGLAADTTPISLSGSAIVFATLLATDIGTTASQDFEETATPGTPASNFMRVYAADDSGTTVLNAKDSAGSVSPLSHFKQAGTGAVARSNYNKQLWRVDVEDYGNVSTDALGCINRAIDYVNGTVGGGEVHFDAREYSLTGPVIQKTNVRLIGKGPANTRLKLATNANSPVIKTLNFDALLGGATIDGPTEWAIVGMTLDGNRTNQSGSANDLNGISAYGYRYLVENVAINNVKGHGVRTDWAQFGELPMEATIRRLKIDTCGRHGFRFGGPHDSFGEDIIVVDASQETDNSYDGFLLDSFGTGRWLNLHAWHRSTVTNRMFSAGRIETGANEFIACHFEGGRQCLFQRGDYNVYKGCFIFGGFSTSVMAVVRGSHVFFEAKIYDSVPSGAACLQIGELGVGPYFSHFDVIAITAATNAVVISTDGGRNTGIIKTVGSTNAYSGSWSTDSAVLVQKPDGTYEERGTVTHNGSHTYGALLTTTIELGHASDTTLARGAAGRMTVEGVNVPTISSTDALTNKTLTLTAGTTGAAPLNFASGTNLTTATAGAREYDGKAFYATPVASSRAVDVVEHFLSLSANQNGTNVNTAQPWFPGGGATGLNVAGDTTYFFEGVLAFKRTAGTTSHTVGLLFGGTATLTSIAYQITSAWQDATAIDLTSGAGALLYTQAATSVTITTPASTSANEIVVARVSGMVRINGAGTFIPQFQYSAAPGGAPSVQANTFFKMRPVGSGSVLNVGNWS